MFYPYYAGDLERWFSYHCPGSIYIGTGEPMLFGEDTIQPPFNAFQGQTPEVVEEEYANMPLSDMVEKVCGKIADKNKGISCVAITHFIMSCRLTNDELK